MGKGSGESYKGKGVRGRGLGVGGRRGRQPCLTKQNPSLLFRMAEMCHSEL